MKIVAILLGLLLLFTPVVGAQQEAPTCPDLDYLEQIYTRVNEELTAGQADKLALATALYDLVDLRWQLIQHESPECSRKVLYWLILYLDYHQDSALLGVAQTLDKEDPRYRLLAESQREDLFSLAVQIEAAFQ